MSNHTAGEWHVCKHGTPDYAPQYGVYADGPDFVIVRGDNAKADAELIAGALDLLEALEWITRCASIRGPAGTTAYIISDDAMDRAKAAVRKAKGES